MTEITNTALDLVQDPFGNYVVQYVLDLGIEAFTNSLVQQFIGHVCILSVQKFSSNVIEKVGGTRERERERGLVIGCMC